MDKVIFSCTVGLGQWYQLVLTREQLHQLHGHLISEVLLSLPPPHPHPRWPPLPSASGCHSAWSTATSANPHCRTACARPPLPYSASLSSSRSLLLPLDLDSPISTPWPLPEFSAAPSRGASGHVSGRLRPWGPPHGRIYPLIKAISAKKKNVHMRYHLTLFTSLNIFRSLNLLRTVIALSIFVMQNNINNIITFI